MLKYTRAVVNDALHDLKAILFFFSLVTQIIYIIYLAYAVFAKIGIIYINIALLVISVAYLIFFLVFNQRKDKKSKRKEMLVRHTKIIIKLIINAVSLGIAIYGLYCATKEVNAISLMLTILMLIFWCLQVVLEVIVLFFERKKSLIMYGLQKDFEPINNAINRLGNIVRKVAGYEEVESDVIPSNVEEYLDKVLIDFECDQAVKKAKKKAARRKLWVKKNASK